MKLKSGAEIEDGEFFAILNGGKRKALEEEVRVRFGDDFIEFKRGDFTHLQATLDILYKEYSDMRVRLGLDPKPRVRIAAGSHRFPLSIVATGETWRSIPGADAWYEVSSLGNFRNVKLGKPTIVRHVNSVSSVSVTKTSKLGYRQPAILNAAKVVAQVFCSRSDDCVVLHFKDGNRFNIQANNIVWIREDDSRRRLCDFVLQRRERLTNFGVAA